MAGGRPTKMTPDVLAKLEDAYLSDATHLQAAIYAGIDEVTLHRYKGKHPEFVKRIEALRGMTELKAKRNLTNSISEGDKLDSKWWLERRDKDFKPKSAIDTKVTVDAGTALIDALRQRRGK